MPYTMDALLPRPERYASLKFRRVARKFYAHRLDYADAYELAVTIGTLGMRTCKLLFEWTQTGDREAARLLAYDVADGVQANRDAYTREEGLACLAAMRENGWVYGKPPEIVRFAALEMRKDGLSIPRVAQAMGFTLDQARHVLNPRKKPLGPVSLADAALVAR